MHSWSDGIPSHAGMTIDVDDPLVDGETRFWEVASKDIPDYADRVGHGSFEQPGAEQWAQALPTERCLMVFKTVEANSFYHGFDSFRWHRGGALID